MQHIRGCRIVLCFFITLPHEAHGVTPPSTNALASLHFSCSLHFFLSRPMKGAEELDPSNKGGTRGGGGGTSARLENHPNLEAPWSPPCGRAAKCQSGTRLLLPPAVTSELGRLAMIPRSAMHGQLASLSTVADDWNHAEVGEESEMDSQHDFR